MLEAGMRAGEVASLALSDVDLANGVATVRRGKGGKGRVVPLGPDASLALVRYLRLPAGTGSRPPRICGWGPRQATSYDALHRPWPNAPRPRHRGVPPRASGTPRTAGWRQEAPR